MKSYILPILSLLFTQAIFASQQNEEPAIISLTKKQVVFELVEDFREPKNIMFSAMRGGSSHCVWVLSILQELSERGHITTFYTRDDHIRFGEQYPSLNTVSSGPPISPLGKNKETLFMNVRDAPFVDFASGLFKRTTQLYQKDYLGILEMLSSRNIDLSICDSINLACIEATHKLRLPLVITSPMPQGPDAAAPYINNDFINMDNPTTKSMSFFERLYDMTIKPVLFHSKLWLYLRRENIQIAPTFISKSRWIEAVKIYNTAFGFEQGRSLGPMAEFVGPILPTKYSGLTTSLDHFLSRHKRVAYIAFGQHAFYYKRDVELIMTALLEAYEANEIDGIIWATRDMRDAFPRHLVTSSNTAYDVDGFFEQQEEKDSGIYFINWAPQMAILSHPSTSMFITHGGAGSLYESFHAGVPVVVYPFFGDQPGAAVTTEKNGAGRYLKYGSTLQEAINIIRAVARDENKFFRSNVNRFKALVQIRSKHGVQRAADVVEEVLFMQLNGKVPHRWDVRRELSIVKAHNLDVYSFLVAMIIGTIYGSVRFVFYLKNLIVNQRIKLKEL